MSDVKEEAQKRFGQFIQLLPVTLQIAGLPVSEPGKYFNNDQMENRAKILKMAYQHARKLAKDAIQE